MLTWHVVRNTEIPIVVLFARVERSKHNIFNRHLHFAAAILRLTLFECVVNVVFFIVRLRLEALGMNWWSLCVSLNVLDVANRDSRNSVLLTTSSELTKNKVKPSTLDSAKSNNSFGVKIWFEKERWRMVHVQVAFTIVAPTPSLTSLSHHWNRRLCRNGNLLLA